MSKAVFHGTVIAESQETELVEGNHYFPPASVRQEYLQPSDTHTVCPWKGTASYYNVVVDAAPRGKTRRGPTQRPRTLRSVSKATLLFGVKSASNPKTSL